MLAKHAGLLAAAVGCCLLTGCVSPYQTTAGPEVELERLQTPVTSLAWATGTDQLLGLTGDDRLVKIDRRTGETLDGVQLSSVGENIALVTHPTELAYVAVPDQDEVAVIETDSMRHVRDLPAGEHPQWVATHPSSHTLLALSQDGTSVTGVDVETWEVKLHVQLPVAPEAEIAAAEGSLTPAFWVVSSGGASHFSGDPLVRARLLAPELEPDTFSPNRDATAAAYLSLRDPSRVVAVELRDGSGRITAERGVGDAIEHVEAKAKEEFRVFLAGRHRLSVLVFDSLDALATVDYGEALAEAGFEDTPVAGVVVGDLYIYLPLQDEPYVLRIHKPSE